MNFDKNKFHIGTYILQPYARTEKHIKDMSECGIDLIFSADYDIPMLDLFEKYGIAAVVSGIVPGWWGGDGEKAGTLSKINPIEKYYEGAKNFKNHPAIVGIDIGDEPSAKDFPYYGEVSDVVRKLFPEKFPYLNLYPNYASIALNNSEQTVNQLGTATYEEHIDEYCKNVPLDYISYDNYLYTGGVAKAYENLRVVADASRRTGRPFWIILQVNSYDPKKFISVNQLKYQAYSALCFGPTIITWACYTAGWWDNNVLDEKGEKTEQYDKLKLVNEELWPVGKLLENYRRVDTHFVAFKKDDPDLSILKVAPVETLSTGKIVDFTVEKGEKVIVGQFVKTDDPNSTAYVICAADDPMDINNKTTEIKFKAFADEVVLAKGKENTVLKPEGGWYKFSLKSSEGSVILLK